MPTKPKADNLTIHPGSVTVADRQKLLGQRGCVVWLTGLSGSGKSTIARALEAALTADGRLAYVLDGDNVRHGLNSDLGFSPDDRDENIRRLGEVAALLADAGVVTITAFISPYRAGRDRARAAVGDDRFVEVFVDAPLDACRQRDPKGLYKKAQSGDIQQFTGIDAPYEPPAAAAVTLKTDQSDVDECVAQLAQHLRDRGFLSARS